MENDYISLQEATRHCSYSQEYLSLRARQGKLKAIKFGRNWVTKEEWLGEYLQQIEEYNRMVMRNKPSSSPPPRLAAWSGARYLNNKKVLKETSPPENLPIEIERPVSSISISLGFVTALTFILAITTIFYSQETFRNAYQNATPLIVELNESFDKGMLDLGQKFAEEISSYVYILGGAGDIVVENTIEVLVDTISLTTASIEDVF